MIPSRSVQFSMSWMLLAVAGMALFFSHGLSFWFLLVVTEVIASYVCVEVLVQGIPPQLLSSSRDNCCRLDGSHSERRAARERKAVRRVRTDLWGLFLILALVGSSAAVAIDQWIFPRSLLPNVVAAAFDDSQDFKSALQARQVDRSFFRWSRSSTFNTNDDIRQHQTTLWAMWPIVAGLAIVGCVAGVWLIRFGYFKTLHEFQQGVQARSNEYVDVDTRRLRR